MVTRLAAAALCLASLTVGGLSVHRRWFPWMGGSVVLAFLLPPLAPLLAVLPHAVPRLVAWGRKAVKRRQMDERFPDLLLALRVAAEEGRGILSAFEGLDLSETGPLREPLLRFRADLRSSFDVEGALRRLADTLNFPAARRLIEALLAGERLGAPLRQTLANQDALSRSARIDRLRRKASYLPYALTFLTGLLFINGAILFGYPRWVHLLEQFGPFLGKGF